MKAELRPASEMKESGVQWLGQIPNSWGTIRFKYVHVGANVGMSIDREYWSDDETDTAFYTAQIKPIHVRYNEFPEWKYTSRNDLLLARNATPYVYLPVLKAAYTDHIIRVDIKPNFDKRYIRYCLQQSIMSEVAEGVSLPTWSVPIWNRQIIPFISLEDQQAIADYLDDRCSKIDEIIAEATASIEDYKELKQAVIFEAVTKGLDKNAPMKDSGIEWIGVIPVSWTYFKLRYVVDDIGDIDHYMPESVTSGIPYVMTGDLRDIASEIEFDSCKQVSYEDYLRLSKKISVHKGDVIFARYASIGVICYVDLDKDFLVSYSCVTIKPKHDLIDGWFLKYYLQSSAFKEEVMRYANSNVQANVGKESMYQAKIALPSMDQQKKIVNYLDAKVGEIESIISEKQALIDDMQMYKKSLIYEAVTGKRRVNDVN